MILGVQIRAARAALGWAIDELAERSGVSARTIKRLEALDGIPPSRTSTLVDIQKAFETAGIEFVGTPEDRPGVRVQLRKRDSK
jgi:transcriptional regulator with XRE-family HTH domain